MFTTLIKRFTSNLFNLNSLIINLFSFHAVTLMGILFSLIFLLIPACKKDLSPVKERQIEIKLTVESAEVTEAWLKLETSPLESEAVYIVKRDTHFVFNGKLYKSDTLLHDENLLPAHEYNYSAYAILNGKTGKIVKASLTTMDTTSHDFEWEIFEWGHHSSSCLHDVAIISPEDIWAVGEIHTEDTDCWNEDSTEWIPPYNAVHWDGDKWELKRIMYNYNGSPVFSPIGWIFAKNKKDIWFGNSVHWDGIKFHNVDIAISIFSGIGTNKMWISSNGELFVVGNKGTIAYSSNNGQSWQKIESGTELTLKDIFGIATDEIYICGGNYAFGRGIVLKYGGINCEKMIEGYFFGGGFDSTQLFKTQLYGSLAALWGDNLGNLYVAGDYVYQFKRNKWNFVKGIPDNILKGPVLLRGYIKGIRGNAFNDIVIAGQRETLLHFNGSTWRRIGSPYYYWSDVDWYEVDMKGDCIVAVGRKGGKAAIIYLHR